LFDFSKFLFSDILSLFLDLKADNSQIVVGDLFMGTGTTGVAAASFGCKFFGSDMDSQVVVAATARLNKAFQEEAKGQLLDDDNCGDDDGDDFGDFQTKSTDSKSSGSGTSSQGSDYADSEPFFFCFPCFPFPYVPSLFSNRRYCNTTTCSQKEESRRLPLQLKEK